MKKILTILILLTLNGCSYISQDEINYYNNSNGSTNKETNKASSESYEPDITCREKLFTVDHVQKIANEKGIDYKVTQEYVDELNSKPLCKDLCKEQLEYSKKHNGWFAKDDLREMCKSKGIILPNN